MPGAMFDTHSVVVRPEEVDQEMEIGLAVWRSLAVPVHE